VNAETAQTLLRCYRPGKRVDSRTEKAARYAQEDPELAKTLTGQIEFDQQIIDVIHYIQPPENLRQKLNELRVKPEGEKTPLRKQMINPAVLTAMFGVIVILGSIGFLIWERMQKFPGREEVENMLGVAGKMNGTELEPVTSTTAQLGDWFYMRGYDGFEAPPELAALPVIGSRVFKLDGRTVAQTAVGSADALRFLVFQFHASEFGVQMPVENEWRILANPTWVGALRQHGDHCFLIVSRGGKPEMEELLKGLPAK